MEFVLLFFSDLQKISNIKTPPIKSFKLFKQKLTSEYVSYSFSDLQTYSNIKKIITSVFGSKSPLFQETSSLRLSELRRRSIHGFSLLIKIAGRCLPFVQFASWLSTALLWKSLGQMVRFSIKLGDQTDETEIQNLVNKTGL